MKTGWLTHELYYWHDTGNGALDVPAGLTVQPGEYAENAETKRRFRNLVEVSSLYDQLTMLKARPATQDEVLRFHTPELLKKIQDISNSGGGWANPAVPMGAGSYEIAMLAAGGTLEAVDRVASGDVDNAYVLCRPPGHHATANQSMGFCIFGNAVLGIMHAQAVHGVGRIAIVDWDVHHGNGTQSAFYDDPSVLTISLHQDGLFPPNSGLLEERGGGAGEGFNLNIPLPPGSGSGAYLAAMNRVVIPALDRFKPEMIFVASGFDASALDPLGTMMLGSDTYHQMTNLVMDASERHCGGKIVMTHEGGYSAAYVPYCGLETVSALLKKPSGITDPFLEDILGWGGQDLQPHQDTAVSAAESLLDAIT